MARLIIPYSPRPLQRVLHEQLEQNRWNVIICHRRFGKTVMEINRLIKAAFKCPRPDPRYAYLAPTYAQGKTIAWDFLKKYSVNIPDTKINESELRIDYPNRSRIRIFGGDNPDSLRGIYLDGAVLDEYALIRPKVFTEIIRPALADREGWADFIGTPKGKNHFYDLLNTAQLKPDWFTAIYKASATDIIPPEELEKLRQNMSSEEYEQEFECSFVAPSNGRKVYPEFRRELHVSPKPLRPADALVIRGWDNTGLSPACIITQLNSTGQWLVLKEFCGEDIGILDFGEMVNLWCAQEFGSKAKYRDIGDPAGKNRDSNKMSPADYLRRIGIFVEDGIQTFKIRREAVAGRLTKLINGAPAILIDPACTRLIDGFEGGYAYPEIGNSGVFKDEPVKNEYSHCFVGKTKVRTLSGEKPIENIKIGDYVNTPVGYKMVTATMNSLSSDLREIVFSNGRKVVCTSDHPFYTEKGIAFADTLQYNDVLLGINTKETKIWADQHNIKSKNSTVSSSIENPLDIIRRIISRVDSICTATFGSIITERYLTDTASIISTGIKQTTGLKTWNFSTQANTQAIIAEKELPKTRNPLCEVSRLQEKPLKLGTLPMKADSGIVNTEKKRGLIGSLNGLSVLFVKKNTKATQEKKGIAQEIVNLKHVVYQALTMLFANALNATRNLKSISTAKPAPVVKVVQVNRLTELNNPKRVYDLTVEDAHCFFAEGVLVSNCHDALQYPATRLFINEKLKTVKPYVPAYNGGAHGWMGA